MLRRESYSRRNQILSHHFESAMAGSAVKSFFAALWEKIIVVRFHFIRILDGLIATRTNITLQEPLDVPKSCTQENEAGTVDRRNLYLGPRVTALVAQASLGTLMLKSKQTINISIAANYLAVAAHH